MYSGIVAFSSSRIGLLRVLRDDRVAARVRHRVGLRVGGGKAPKPLGQIRHRPAESDAQATLDVLLVASALDLDQVGQGRGDDPAIALPLLFASECLA